MRSEHPPPVRSTNQPTNPRNDFSGTPEAMAHVATCCEQQESLDAQNRWRHPVPALMTRVSVPLEKSTSRLSCPSYKICLLNVQLHPTHAIPHPRHLDHGDKCHLKRLPTECYFLRRWVVFGKTVSILLQTDFNTNNATSIFHFRTSYSSHCFYISLKLLFSRPSSPLSLVSYKNDIVHGAAFTKPWHLENFSEVM